jgi:ubiquinone/menaquinone biosynthesis C-methylase UbiE
MDNDEQLNNKYVRDYYNKAVGGMSDGYTKSRWFSTSVGKFDYIQTKRALVKALSYRKYKSAIEIGPGDAVWTEIIKERVEGGMHLVEQSDEMLSQAKVKLEGKEGITFERSDYLNSEDKKDIDLVISLRCFEYFDNKKASVEKIFNCLVDNGRFILVTKNSKLFTTKSAQTQKVHSDQLSKSEVVNLLQTAGFVVDCVYPATMRWKIKYAPMRWFFDLLHMIAVVSNGGFKVPFLESRSTESYTYVATKPSI